jgi:hypothetical protein
MAIRATHAKTGTDITISPVLDAVSQRVVDEVYQSCGVGVLECREHDDNPDLRLDQYRGADGRIRGAWVYLQRRRGADGAERWVIAHHPHGIGREFRAHEVTIMSDQHKWQRDYYTRAVDDAGFRADQEVKILGTRIDVVAKSPAGRFGFEVQHSRLPIGKVRTRHRKARDEGIPLTWSADQRNPDWAFKVPHVEANVLPDGCAPRRSWTVTTGPREVIPVRCTQPNLCEFGERGCWLRRRGRTCGGWHAIFRPLSGLVVDDIAQQVPARELVPLDTRPLRQGHILVRAHDYKLWESDFAHQVIHQPAQPNSANRCGRPIDELIGQLAESGVVTEYAEPVASEPHLLWPPTTIPVPVPDAVLIPGQRHGPDLNELAPDVVDRTKCAECGQRLLLTRPGRTLCTRCLPGQEFRIPTDT